MGLSRRDSRATHDPFSLGFVGIEDKTSYIPYRELPTTFQESCRRETALAAFR